MFSIDSIDIQNDKCKFQVGSITTDCSREAAEEGGPQPGEGKTKVVIFFCKLIERFYNLSLKDANWHVWGNRGSNGEKVTIKHTKDHS